MSNPAAELTTQDVQPEREMSEEDILKRLEPKDEEEQDEPQPEGEQEDPPVAEEEEPEGEPQAPEEDEPSKEDEWLNNKRKITVQGEEIEVTADEAFKGYMRQQDYTRKTQEAAKLTEQITQERQFVKQEYENRINQLNSLAGVLYQELVGDQAKLAELAQSDPAQWVAKQQEMAQKSALLNQVQQHHLAIEQMKKNEADKSRIDSLRENEAKLLDMLPEWKDPNKRSAEERGIANALISMGYTPDELNELIDHRAVLIARKAWLYDQAQAVKAKQVKAPATPPKAVKPGNANTNPQTPQKQRIEQLAKRAQRTGRTEDVASLLLARS